MTLLQCSIASRLRRGSGQQVAPEALPAPPTQAAAPIDLVFRFLLSVRGPMLVPRRSNGAMHHRTQRSSMLSCESTSPKGALSPAAPNGRDSTLRPWLRHLWPRTQSRYCSPKSGRFVLQTKPAHPQRLPARSDREKHRSGSSPSRPMRSLSLAGRASPWDPGWSWFYLGSAFAAPSRTELTSLPRRSASV